MVWNQKKSLRSYKRKQEMFQLCSSLFQVATSISGPPPLPPAPPTPPQPQIYG